jgi:hypothetical protein
MSNNGEEVPHPFGTPFSFPLFSKKCVCMCVCVNEREREGGREREREGGRERVTIPREN